MTYALCLSYINARHFKSKIDIFGNFLPGMVFFQSIFGYLVFCIVYKWSIDWYSPLRPDGSPGPPGLLNLLIYMFLQPGKVKPEEQLYPGQRVIQVILLLVAVACVPILLLLKPLYLRWEHNRARALGYRGIGETSRFSALDADDEDGQLMNGGRDSMGSDHEAAAMITQDIGDEEHEEFEFSEIMIHQTIHTIGKHIPVRYMSFFGLISSRILSQLCLSHRLLPPPLGPFACPPATLRRSMDHDSRQRLRIPRCSRRCYGRCFLLPVVRAYNCHPVCHGGHECDVT